MYQKTVRLLSILILCSLICSCGKESLDNSLSNTICHDYLFSQGYNNNEITRLCNYHNYVFPVDPVSDDEVKDVIQYYLELFPKEVQQKKRIIEDGDLVKIAYEISFDGQVIFSVKEETVLAGKVNFDSAIEESVLNKMVGKPYSITYSSNDYPGKPGICTITPLYIYTIEPAELTADFVKEHFRFDSVDEWTGNVKATIFEQHQYSAWSKSIDKIIERSVFIINDDDIIKHATELAAHELAYSIPENVSPLEYISDTYNLSEEEFYSWCYKSCERRVKECLIVGAIANAEGIIVSKEELKDYCELNDIDYALLVKADEIICKYEILRNHIEAYLCPR